MSRLALFDIKVQGGGGEKSGVGMRPLFRRDQNAPGDVLLRSMLNAALQLNTGYQDLELASTLPLSLTHFFLLTFLLLLSRR